MVSIMTVLIVLNLMLPSQHSDTQYWYLPGRSMVVKLVLR